MSEAIYWADLIMAIAKRDDMALADLSDRSSRLVYGLALRMLRHAEDAEEVAADVYLRVWRRAGDYDPGRGC